jgi:hypothetical protein
MIIFVYIGVAFLLLFGIFWLVLISYEEWKESELRKDILKKKKREGET